MNVETARGILGWCVVLNYGVMMLWFLCFRYGHDGIYRIRSCWFRLSEEQFDALHYLGMSIYKISILLFTLVPYVALLIVG